jgi:hypothetical protein
MDASSPFCQTGRARLLLVTLAIASATAAVAAGVALTDRRSGEAGVQSAGAMVAPAMPAPPRHAPLSETATTLPGLALHPAPGDSLLPAASEALTGADSAAEETTPTF